ncbi:MAG: nucleotidyltransferase family protein [Deltaproteobacteria bacterium]|nr:nucleotidyltransferase family protein [Deltaproteobacteria bacterium]
MGNRAEIIKKIKEQYPFLSKQYGICRIGIFGSVAMDSARPDSDVDIVVEFERPIGLKFMECVTYMENLFGKKVDVLTKDGIKNIRVKNVSTEIEKNIIYV